MNSSSKTPPFSSPPNTSDSLNGLKFGQKIYFEDVGIAAPPKSGGGSPSKPPPAPGKKGRSAAVAQGPRCQVEGCGVDLSEAKAYYGRHKVCGVHSKTPTVVVNGLNQRFCQQCSRFHQLSEFDQGKRSCRRRLAGHNERRRKPPPGSLFPSPYRRLPSSVFETGKGGGFLMDFSTYPKVTERDTWPTIKAANHATPPGKSLPHLWHNDSANPSSGPFLQGSSSGIQYPVSPTIPSGECFTGTSNSGRALSLLSNTTWGPQGGSPGSFVSVEEAQMVQSTTAATHGVRTNQFSSVPWGFKGHEDDVGSHAVPPHLGSNQFAQPADNQYSCELGSNQHRQYIQLEHSRAFDSSTQFLNWSL